MSPRRIEIESVDQLEAAVTRSRAGDRSMAGWEVQDVDLTGHEDALHDLDPRGAMFLGSAMSQETAERLRAGGALIFPEIPDVPFDPWRARLYTPAELYADLEKGYPHTPDAQVYAWSRRTAGSGSVRDLLAQAVHDSSIDDALAEALRGRRAVGVMGGHAVTRTDQVYADAAGLAHGLAASGLTVATGGGPGAMEAANLGARLADHDQDTLAAALAEVAAVASYEEDIGAWVRSGLDAVAGLADSGRSVGIPTWHYGHEPPNPFSSLVAKYFRNAVREDVLLEVCRGGIVFLPGAAGTVQEVFQSACSNYYAPDTDVAPMVFVGREYWTEELPAWPLVSALAAGRVLEARIDLVDSTAEVLGLLVEEA